MWKKVIAGVLICAVMLFSSSAAFAESYYAPINPQIIDADSNVTGLTITDEKPGYFANQNKLVPGDTVQGSYKIHNTSNYASYQLYLYSETPSGSGSGAQDLIHQMKLTLTLDGKEIYNGTADGAEDGSGRTMLRPAGNTGSNYPSGVYLNLGAIRRNSEHILKAVFAVPSVLGNLYQNASGKITWTFYAEASGSPTSSATPPIPTSSGTTSNGTGSSSSADSGSVSSGPQLNSSSMASNGGGQESPSASSSHTPSADGTISNSHGGGGSSGSSTPNGFLNKVFKTGDDAPIAGALAVFVAAEAVILVLLRQRRKRK